MTDINTIDGSKKDCIKSNIPSRAIRYSTQSKNVLNSAGAMYIGTGLIRETSIAVNGGTTPTTYTSYITAVLDGPDEAGMVLKPLEVRLYEGDNTTTRLVGKGIYPCWVDNFTTPTKVIAPRLVEAVSEYTLNEEDWIQYPSDDSSST